MKKLISLSMLFACPSFGFQYPAAQIQMGHGSSSVYYGETLVIPVSLKYAAFKGYKQWTIPIGSYLLPNFGPCPIIPFDMEDWGMNVCHMSLLIPGNVLGQIIQGTLNYTLWGEYGHKPHYYNWNYTYYSPPFYVTVIPHPLSLSSIPEQYATANQTFIYPLKWIVTYYDENLMAGIPAKALVEPIEQDGIRFDPNSFSIVGKPTRIGTYHFKITVYNERGSTESSNLVINIQANARDRPVFKSQHSMVSALPEQKYLMNLMELIEPQPGFWTKNQISFRIVPNENTPKWLSIAKDDTRLLKGEIPSYAAGRDIELILIASSNTGGDSEALTVKIPIAYDPIKKPQMIPFQLHHPAGSKFSEDLRKYIKDTTQHSELKLVLDTVTPAAPWLTIRDSYVLEGIVPQEATGQLFELTLRASTPVGGNSDPLKIPFQVAWDKQKTPSLKSNHLQLPLLYPNRSFRYNFKTSTEITPSYEEIPYEVSYAPDMIPPPWLKLEKNQLTADWVPSDISGDFEIQIVIRNIPGGYSEVYSLKLTTKARS